MTDDADGNEQTDRSVTSRESGTAKSAMEPSREEWEELRSDPDIASDLGYELGEWEQFETLDGTDQVMFLPANESALKDAAFVVVESDMLRDLGEFN